MGHKSRDDKIYTFYTAYMINLVHVMSTTWRLSEIADFCRSSSVSQVQWEDRHLLYS